MTPRSPVRLADPRADALPLRSAALVALVCCGAGFGGVALAPQLRGGRVHHSDDASDAPIHPATPHAVTAAATPEPSAQRVVEPTQARTGGDKIEDALSPTPIEPAAPAHPPGAHPSAASEPSFEPGHVAYLRCDGAEVPEARFPCPRDRALEIAVWDALRTLPQCVDAKPGRGRGEARLTWGGDGEIDVLFRKEPVSELDLAAVSKCAGERMAELRSSVVATKAVAVFRFELR